MSKHEFESQISIRITGLPTAERAQELNETVLELVSTHVDRSLSPLGQAKVVEYDPDVRYENAEETVRGFFGEPAPETKDDSA